jgi:hypothetical protein
MDVLCIIYTYCQSTIYCYYGIAYRCFYLILYTLILNVSYHTYNCFTNFYRLLRCHYRLFAYRDALLYAYYQALKFILNILYLYRRFIRVL